MRHYDICLQTIPGRDAKPAQTIDRAAWLKKYLAVRAAFSFTDAYKAAQAELAELVAPVVAPSVDLPLPDGHRLAAEDEAGWYYLLPGGKRVWITEAR